jgi:hypothetical protein
MMHDTPDAAAEGNEGFCGLFVINGSQAAVRSEVMKQVKGKGVNGNDGLIFVTYDHYHTFYEII